MNIDDVMAARGPMEPKCISPDQPITEMARRLREFNIGALVVTNSDDQLIGIVSERDLVGAVASTPTELEETTVADIMTNNVITCTPKDGVRLVLSKMNSNRIRHIPVVNGEKPITVISIREFETICNHLQDLALTDELTGLSNRRHFMEMLAAELSRYSRTKIPFSIAMADIDHFKKINDTYGHDVGDDAIVKLADIMRDKLRTHDIIGRLGGEEFGIIFPNTELPGAVLACEKLAALIRSESIKSGDADVSFTVSFGVAQMDGKTDGVGGLMKLADELLYKSKNGGRDRVSFRPLKLAES